ncbi:Fibronectin type III domain-containing protein [Blastococcus fimeti]|nr:Fibronectin type III domain-containing protein [Blastococcus fimeti]
MGSSVQSLRMAWTSARTGRRLAAMLVVLALALLGLPFFAGAAQAAPGQRIELEVLVVSNGDPSAEAIATQLDREGVPYTKVRVGDGNRPTVDAAFLADAATNTARFQAVVLPNQAGGGLAPAEVAALADYERAYGIRQVNAYDYPGASMGFAVPTYAGSLDGGRVALGDAALSGPFGYLDGTLAIDDFDPGLEVYGYLAQPAPALPDGSSFTPLLSATAPAGETGVLAGALAQDGREQLTLTAAYNPAMQWWNEVAHGVVTWMTRGINLGHQRNYFAVHVDDILLPDGRWSVDGNCTPGDDCIVQDPPVTTEDIRMTPADVDRLLAWQEANDFALDMVYNAGGIDLYAEDNDGAADPLAAALLANKDAFPWINHTLTHPYLGCIQIAPSVQGQPWRCATSEADLTDPNRQDPTVPAQEAGGIYWASPAFLTEQIRKNVDWAREVGLADFDPAELVTGEHSGLVTTNQPADNPFLGPVLAELGVEYVASDASRELLARPVGSGAITVPRYPMNIYYNTATYREQIDEYNWYYTSAEAGGGGICENNPASTCITPLPAGDDAAAKASFEGYLAPLEIRNAFGKVITNDPRPFYVHQSNLAEDGLLYPVVEGVLDQYRATYADSAGLIRTDMESQSRQLDRMTTWRAASAGTTAYLDRSGVHVSGAGTEVPLTMPAGSTGVPLESYGGQLSGWTTGTVTAVPPTSMGGYGGTQAAVVPGAPGQPSAIPGDGSATLSWTAPTDTGGSDLTGYEVSVFEGDATSATRTVSVAAETTAAVIDGLTNGTPHTFTVAAVNEVGTGAASAASVAVTPMPGTAAAPTLGEVVPGNESVTVSWTAPAGSGITGYAVRVYQGTELVRTVSAPAGATSQQITGLVNGTGYTVEVAAVNLAGPGASSARSAVVTPRTTPGAPLLGAVTTGNASASLTWTAPESDGGSAITGYEVAVVDSEDPATLRSVQRPADATDVAVSGLTNGRTYWLTVSAVNAAGTGAPSARASVTPVAPVLVPGAPTIQSVTAGDGSAALTWTPPTGDAPVTGYAVTVFAGDATVDSAVVTVDGTTARITGLVNGTGYTVSVAALNGEVRGPDSARSGVVTPATVPGRPTGVTASAGDGSASLTWAAPAVDGGAAVTGYEVAVFAGEQRIASAVVTVDGTSATVTGLTNGTAYTFAVAAGNRVGTGEWSVRSTAVTPAGVAVVPGAPTITSVAGGNATAELTWSAPTEDGGAPVTGYEVTVLSGGQPVGTAVVTVDGTSATVTGLTNGTAYTFTVAAVNAVGTGAPSVASSSVTPRTVPGAPTNVAGIPGNGSVTVTWSAPADTGGSALTGYEIRAYSGGSGVPVATVAAAASATSTVVPALINGTEYTVTVAAVNGAGAGAESAPSLGVTPAAPATEVPGQPGEVPGGPGQPGAVPGQPGQPGQSTAVPGGAGAAPGDRPGVAQGDRPRAAQGDRTVGAPARGAVHSDDDVLAMTGADVAWLAASGLGLLVVGLAVLEFVRRRRTGTAPSA